MMSSCMRYCTRSRETVSGFEVAIFRIRVWLNPPRSASTHFTVGGN